MLMDTVYEGALAVQGPLLASFGASALVVGLVSGIGEATSLAGRLFSGPLADRTGRYWTFAILGYVVTALAVPAMGFAGSLLAVSALIVFERLGKSIRTPSRDAMLSHAAGAVGRGKGFALHEVMDQVGAIAGPLTVAALLSATGNNYRVALGMLVVPGLAAVCVLLFLRHRMPHPEDYEGKVESASSSGTDSRERQADTARELPRVFWLYSAGCMLVLVGVATFGVISFHAVSTGLASDAAVPLYYALAMAIDGVFAAVSGLVYDKIGPRIMLALPLLAAAIPWLAYSSNLVPVMLGIALWGACLGIQESTMRAAIADMVPVRVRATAYGVFSVFTGVGSLLGGIFSGGLYTAAPSLLGPCNLAIEALALALIASALHKDLCSIQ